jgi:predicted enzyme related to lactoylglutathione lyase
MAPTERRRMSTVKTAVRRFVWHEQVSPDPKAAKRFYTELFGWELEAFQPSEYDYEMIKVGDQTHGGFSAAEGDAPPHWLGHVSVEDVDDTVLRAEAAGGRIVNGPMDMPEVGRFALIADPQGGLISAYKPEGEGPIAEGTFVWDELATDDVEGAKSFYTEVFGWRTEDMDMGEAGTYTMLKRDGDPDAGGITQKAPGAPGGSIWYPYVATDDVDGTASKAKELGATVVLEPVDVPTVGRLAILIDPTGATFGLFQPSGESTG